MTKIKMLESKGFIPPKAIELQYGRELSALIAAMVRDYKTILKIYSKKKEQITLDAKPETWLTTDVQARLNKLGKAWAKRFEEFAKTKSVSFINKILKQTDVQLKSSLKDFFSTQRMELIGKVVPQALQQSMNAAIAANVSLITSIPDQYLVKVQGAVSRAVMGGGSLKELTEEVAKYGDFELKRAKLIANDQTRKAFSSLTVRRFNQIGVTKGKWMHSAAGKNPRDYHKRKWDGVSGLKDGHPNGLNGFIFDIDNPPIIDEKTGERGFPGDLINCHCILVAVIEQ